MRSTFVPGAAALIAAAVLAPRAEALQLEVTRAQLCSVSDAVVIGHVVDMETNWAAGETGGVERRAALSVEHTLHGEQVPGYDIVLPGGSIGSFNHWVEDVPDLKIDGRYMVFLSRTDAGWKVIGGDFGAVRVYDAATAWKGESVSSAADSLGGCDAK